ncbi:MAG TPA: RagB/SusD family nutrient uptake outer membrane protein [Chitinophagaceae bacterium]|nr:RagB/SusD family nutrient uptake outer membrane protein [Chitinophagaceae bacterium]
MKNKIMLLALASILSVSCSKEFIRINPVSTVSTEILYKTDKDYFDALVGSYAVFQTEYNNMWQYGDLRGDDTRAGLVSNLTASDMDKFILNNDAGILLTTWQNYYNVINRVNTILSRIETADPAVIKNKDQYTGEAKFIRALAYFNLVRIFGNVPMPTTTISAAQAYKSGREKADKIYDAVSVKDLVDAEKKLPLKYPASEVGRATQGAAKSLLGKVYLTRRDFPNAEAKLKEVTTMGYALLRNFNDLFDYTKDEHHSEYIFDIEYEQGVNEGSIFTTQFSLSFQGAGVLANVMAAAYGLPPAGGGDQGSPSESFMAAFDPTDLRKDISVATGLTVNGVYTPISTTGIGSFTKKYLTPIPRANDSRANWKVIRYADVLLMYAEALNENGKTAEAHNFLNQVRTRAGLKPYSNPSKDDTREAIYQERRFELHMEGHRWFDLVRTGRALSVMQPYGMKPHMTVFPIPQSQIEIINNRDVFPQNEGYQ